MGYLDQLRAEDNRWNQRVREMLKEKEEEQFIELANIEIEDD